MWVARDEEEIRGAGSGRGSGRAGGGVVHRYDRRGGGRFFFCLHVCVRGGGGC